MGNPDISGDAGEGVTISEVPHLRDKQVISLERINSRTGENAGRIFRGIVRVDSQGSSPIRVGEHLSLPGSANGVPLSIQVERLVRKPNNDIWVYAAHSVYLYVPPIQDAASLTVDVDVDEKPRGLLSRTIAWAREKYRPLFPTKVTSRA